MEIVKKNEIQIPLFIAKSCAFTGHRELKKDFSIQRLYALLEELIQKGVAVFYNGLACGFDLTVCEQLLLLKETYKDIRIIGCIPCIGQEKSFFDEDKKLYHAVKARLDEQVFVSSTPYFRGCMQKRNRYMCDHADVLVAYLKKDTGGTAYTVRYFQNKYPQKQVLFL